MTLNRFSFVIIMTLNTTINHDRFRINRDNCANIPWRQHDHSGFTSIYLSNHTKAASCGSYVNQGASQQGLRSGSNLCKLAKCDKTMAKTTLGAFVPRATDVDTMVQLTETAITVNCIFKYR